MTLIDWLAVVTFKRGLKMNGYRNLVNDVKGEHKTKDEVEIELLKNKIARLDDRISGLESSLAPMVSRETIDKLEKEESERQRKIAYHMAEIEKIKLGTDELKNESLIFNVVGIIQKETFWSGYKEEFVFRKFTDIYDMKTENLNTYFRDLEYFTLAPSGDYVVLEQYIYEDWYYEHGTRKHYYDATGYRMVTKDGNIDIRDDEQCIVYEKEK